MRANGLAVVKAAFFLSQLTLSQLKMLIGNTLSVAAGLLMLLAVPSLVQCGEVCGVNNLPEFGELQQQGEEGLSNKIWAMVPSYTFSCPGVVQRWRARVESGRNLHDRYQMTFSVWRTVENADGTCSYDRVGQNSHSGLAPEVDTEGAELGIVTLEVPEEERFSVEAGDFLGFTVRHYEVDGEVVRTGAASVLTVNSNITNATVYVWQPPIPSMLPCIDGDMPEGVIPFAAAPVVTVEMVQPTPTVLPSTSELSMFTKSPSTTSSVTRVNSTPAPDTHTATLPQIAAFTAGSLLVVGVVLLSLVCLAVCVLVSRRKGKKKMEQNKSYPDHVYMEVIPSYVYSSRTSFTIPDHYKSNGNRQMRSIYDTLTPQPEPLPTLNPTLSSNSLDSPAFLSHSETPPTTPSEFELLYSTISPMSTAPDKRRKESSTSIDCPLYSSLTLRVCSLSEEPEYSTLSSPGSEPPYALPTMPCGYENARCDNPCSRGDPASIYHTVEDSV